MRLLLWAPASVGALLRFPMKYFWFKAIVISVALAVGFGSYFLTKKPDGHIEQAAEAVLSAHGVDIDFSPEN